MQVKNSTRVSYPTPREPGANRSGQAFADIFTSCRETAGQKTPDQSPPPNLFLDRDPATVSRMIPLGTISPEKPTVSHLLVRHLDQDCWQTIHSDRNRDKPYTRIPAGTPIYFDPASREISWTPSAWHAAPPGAVSGPADAPARDNGAIDRAIDRASAAYNLPRRLITGVIKAESDFRVRAVSPAGARGLMQLMPETARELGVDDPFDIEQNIDGGARYLKQLLDMFNGDLEQALAAYNAGPGAVKKHHGRVPYPETRFYVERVLSFIGTEA